MSAAGCQLEIVATGAMASLQDLGRRGHRRVGVPWAGVLDPRGMRLANALAGQPEGAPVIECFDGGLRLKAHGGSLRLAVAGDAELVIEGDEAPRSVPAWSSLTLRDGQTLLLRRLRHGRVAAVAVEGLALPRVLGSSATYARAHLGGWQGRALKPGDRLPVPPATARADQILPEPPAPARGPLRAVPGPQADHFTETARAAFVAAAYQVSTDADRMGVRLQGPALTHAGAPEIVSDATVPGSIQVPGSGQPIVLLADAQTAGGYPKIGTVIGADLPRLAQARPGDTLQFTWVDVAEGERLARAEEARTRALLAALRPWLPGGIDTEALYTANLVSGVLHALSAEHRPT
jgi:5-oxoprolinase (ATP-hydrolysing) subunit C